MRLVRKVPGPRLQRVGGRLVARPTAPKGKRRLVHLAALVDEERDLTVMSAAEALKALRR